MWGACLYCLASTAALNTRPSRPPQQTCAPPAGSREATTVSLGAAAASLTIWAAAAAAHIHPATAEHAGGRTHTHTLFNQALKKHPHGLPAQAGLTPSNAGWSTSRAVPGRGEPYPAVGLTPTALIRGLPPSCAASPPAAPPASRAAGDAAFAAAPAASWWNLLGLPAAAAAAPGPTGPGATGDAGRRAVAAIEKSHWKSASSGGALAAARSASTCASCCRASRRGKWRGRFSSGRLRARF